MKRPLVPALLLGLATLVLGGCAHGARRPGPVASHQPKSIALAITVNGALQPTPAQYAAIQAQAVRQFGPLGYVVVTDLSLADRILRIDFTPNPNDPENSGRATLLGFRANPSYASARSSIALRYPTSFGYAGAFSNTDWYALNNFGYGYYGYENSYYDGYSYSSPTLNPTRPTTPVTNKPTNPPFRHDSDRCPPDLHRVQPLTGRFAADFTPFAPNDYPPTPREPGRWRGPGGSSTSTVSASSTGGDSSGGRTSWRSERLASGSERATHNEAGNSRGSWWRGSSSSSSSDSGNASSSSSSYSSSSSSSSSYSSSSSSSDSGSSASSSSSSYASSGGGGGGGSSGTHDSVSTRQQN